MPQFAPSVCTLVQSEPQVVALQVQAPAEQVVRPVQAVPLCQTPLTQVRGTLLAQSLAGSAHAAHLPAKHAGVAPVHTSLLAQVPFVHSCEVVGLAMQR